VRRHLLACAAFGAVAVLALGGCGGSDGEPRPDLVLVSSRDGDYAVYAMNADGSRQVRLSAERGDPASPSELFFQVEPAWSPDGRRLAFSSKRSGSFDIYVMNADGKGTRRLTSTKEDDSHPTWSPDGTRIAFARAPGDIYVLNADGSGALRISHPTVEEAEPAWSPDGDWIAYVRRTPGSPIREVWVVRPDGSDAHAVTSLGASSYTPAWSPDSSRIVFTSNVEGELYELYTIGVDGKGRRAVAATIESMFEPAWSPDGTRIAFSEAGAIFTVELGGSGEPTKLTDTDNNDSSPAWNPRPPPVEG
jgi:Tol biopolymer transport system component